MTIRTMRRGVVVLAVAGGWLLPQAARAEVKKSIAVAPIGWNAGSVSWLNGEAIHAQLISELTNSGRYRVVERENLQGILDEQDMGKEGRTRGGSSPKTGDIEGAQLMIKAVVTDCEEESGKGGSGGIAGIRVGKDKTIYRVTMDVRIYDLQTSLIIGTATVTAEMEKKSKSAGGGFMGIGGEKHSSEGDTTGAITRDLIQQSLVVLDKHADVIGWKAKVFDVKDGQIIIRGGARDGLEAGMKFKVFKLGEKLVDEETGEVLDEGKETEVGELELTEVKEKIAYAKKLTGEDPLKGYLVRLIDDKQAAAKEAPPEKKTEAEKKD
ncbi:MAG: hypothetical protein HJJLKODD_00409 [Phycisphaerae bacterium]|nr:hypothetical protein [Phycisphaerae bacterium]